MASNTTRIMGLSSGLDTESIIQQTLKLTQLKIDSKYRAKTSLVWKQEALTSIKTDIADFRSTFLSALSSLNMRSSSVYNSTVAVLSGANSDAVSVKTSTGCTTGSMEIGQIVSLAKGSSVTNSNAASASGDGFKGDTQLKDLEFAGGGKMDFSNGPVEITIGSKTIELNGTDTLNDMIKKVNDSGAGVNMSYDRLQDKFKIESTTVGAGTLPQITGLDMLGLDKTEEGSKAVVYINGERVERNTNTFDFRGVSITLNRTTGANEEKTTVTLKRDATEALNKIKKFVEAYNTLIAKLEGATKERKNSTEATYTPRTEEELKEMTETQINDWNKVAKKGLLYGDTGLQNLTNSLRSALYSSVEKAGLSPSQIGITTGSYFEGKGGQIALDEEKLLAALEKDPEQVMNAFMGATRFDDGTVDVSKSGWLYKVDDLMSKYVSVSQSNSLDSLKESIKRAQEMIDTMTVKMAAEEEKLYAKYAALETAMSKLNSQSSNFSALLGGG